MAHLPKNSRDITAATTSFLCFDIWVVGLVKSGETFSSVHDCKPTEILPGARKTLRTRILHTALRSWKKGTVSWTCKAPGMLSRAIAEKGDLGIQRSRQRHWWSWGGIMSFAKRQVLVLDIMQPVLCQPLKAVESNFSLPLQFGTDH